ncbi:MAG: hypothetical protein Q8S31_08780 [Alphaproteobacteria bacterium]|nr:hypothetical protein [Alphaproteobacteria bacterium]
MKKVFILLTTLLSINVITYDTNASDFEIHTKCPKKLTNTQLNEIYYNNKTAIGNYIFEAENHEAFKTAMPGTFQKATMYGEGGTIQSTQKLIDSTFFEGYESEGYDEVAPLTCTYEYETALGYTYSFSIKRIIPDEVVRAYNYFGLLPDEETPLTKVRQTLVDTFVANGLRNEALPKIKIIYDFLGIRPRSLLEEITFNIKNHKVQLDQFLKSQAYQYWKGHQLAIEENNKRKEREQIQKEWDELQ